MATDWDYAQMSHTASLAGGPEKWVELIKNEAFSNGITKGIRETKGKLAPWIVVAAGVGVVGTLLAQQTYEWVMNRKEEKQLSVERATDAEAMLISSLTNEAEAVEKGKDLDSMENDSIKKR